MVTDVPNNKRTVYRIVMENNNVHVLTNYNLAHSKVLGCNCAHKVPPETVAVIKLKSYRVHHTIIELSNPILAQILFADQKSPFIVPFILKSH